jgi:aryl-alcohol dehydrogenase-like predicted oxidoreductase
MKNISAQVSRIGFGAATLGNEYGLVDEENDVAIVKRALELG